MKKWVIAVTIVLYFPFMAASQELTAREIVKKANEVMNQERVAVKVKMTIMTTSGKTRELFFDSWSMGHGEKNLIRYTAPRRVKDQAILLLNNADDIWSYFPRTNRVRKLASHAKRQKIQGSDFSYEDMGAGDRFLKDFTPKRLGSENREGHPCHKIELAKKKDVDSNYSRMILWVDMENYMIWAIDYYDEKEDTLKTKTLIMSDMKIIEGIPTPRKMVMYNHLDNTKTVQELLEISYRVDLNEEMFTERGLKK
jgi:outer membrane lipoprotein-sorting protein